MSNPPETGLSVGAYDFTPSARWADHIRKIVIELGAAQVHLDLASAAELVRQLQYAVECGWADELESDYACDDFSPEWTIG